MKYLLDIDDKLHADFKKYCSKSGSTMRFVLISYMQEFVKSQGENPDFSTSMKRVSSSQNSSTAENSFHSLRENKD